jgi:hypothetical protein
MATKQRPKKDTEPVPPVDWRPLPPPRKNKPLLVAAGTLVVLWIAFLLCLALHVFGR